MDYKKTRKLLWSGFFISLALSLICALLSIILIISEFDYFIITFLLLAGTFLFLLLFVFNNTFYNSVFLVLGIIILGHSIRYFQLSGAALILTIGYVFSSLGLFVLAFKGTKSLKNDPYVLQINTFSGWVLALVFLGMFFKLMHYKGGQMLIITGTVSLLLTIINLAFTLPYADYLKWSEFAKKYFYRAILIPMAFAVLFMSYAFLLPNYVKSLKVETDYFWMKDYELVEKPGLN